MYNEEDVLEERIFLFLETLLLIVKEQKAQTLGIETLNKFS